MKIRALKFLMPLLALVFLSVRIRKERPMEMLLMGLTMGLLGLAVSAVLFSAATRNEAGQEAEARELATEPSQFFADHDRLENPPVSVEVLLMDIERHVRLEQEAAESFTAAPTVEALHATTASPLARQD